MKSLRLACLSATLALSTALPAAAEFTGKTPPKPIPATVVLTAKLEKVTGQLTTCDAETATFKTAAGERKVKWAEMTPHTAYNLRQQLVDPKSASDWLDLAELAMQSDMRESAKIAVNNAARVDPAARLKGDAILRGQGAAKTNPAAVAANNTAAAAATTGPSTGPKSAAKYRKGTPEEEAAAIAEARKNGQAIADKMGLKMKEILTPHFIIFTDWDPREYDFLKNNCEFAYAAVSKQFDIPVKENVFIGRCPVYMFAKQADFMKFAATIDGFPAPRTVAGYYRSSTDGTGHMVMWKPDTTRYPNIREAERRWASTLTHEFTHAFVSRYRTDRRIPRWLNEGLAEVISQREFPEPESYAYAKMMAQQPFEFENLFNDNMMPGGEMYPVMQTMVEALIKENRKAFMAMFDDIKEGMEPEAAMKKHYKAGYKEWEPAWRRYAKNLPGR